MHTRHRRLLITFVVAVACGLMGAAVAPRGAAAASPVAPVSISVQGSQLLRNGVPWVPRGVQIVGLVAPDGALSGKQSALYPVLRNLCASGLLDSEVEPSVSGPPRRYYRITKLGRAVAAEWSQSWTATRRFVDSVLKGAV